MEMATATGQVKTGSFNVRLGGLAAVILAGGLLAVLAVGVVGRPGSTVGPSAEEVQRALIDHRAGERAPLIEAPSAAEVQRALIDHRAGERDD
jgi:hypothetical protein